MANSAPNIEQASIRAELKGDTCAAFGITGHGSAPVLALCRELVSAGFNSAAPLEAWRGEILCLRVRSIGEGAGLTVEDDRHGRPRFRRWRERGCGAGLPVAESSEGRLAIAARREPLPGRAP
jgi:hypothetical protein